MENTSKGTPLNVEETYKQGSNYELVIRREIEGTPFTIVTTEGKIFGVMGIHRITEYADAKEVTEEQMVELVKEITWDRITQVIVLMIESKKVTELIEETI